jgi:hypothetical protein
MARCWRPSKKLIRQPRATCKAKTCTARRWAEHFARVGKLREVLADLENYGIALLDAGQQQTERWRVETWHRSRVFTGYRVVRGRGDAKELDHCYAADATDTGAINRAFAMAEARRGLLNLRIVEPEGRTITVE